jgi:threonyl-tRNA synthetase
VLAQAVLKKFPSAKLGIGPAIENGFYYDFELPRPLKEEDLEEIEEEMKKIVKKDLPFEQVVLPREEVIKTYEESDQGYKIDLLKDIPDKEISMYVTGKDDFVDLCRGPHVESTGKIGVVKLDRIAGAYWRGDEKRPMLQRIYGLAFKTKREMEEYLELRKEIELVDHRRLGKQMDLFSFHDESPGCAFWHPKGIEIINRLIAYWRDIHKKRGYVEVRTPVLLTSDTWKRSGHLDNFREKMYMVQTFDSNDFNYAMKPMNCDGGIIIYKSNQHSYKELPIRMGEIGVVHRYESSGETHGLLRVRELTQDDAHIYCTPEQIKDELKGVIDLCLEFYDAFGLEVAHIELSTRPERSVGSDEIWEKAEVIMREVDSMGRTWQCATIQLDFAQPENFDLEYIDEQGEKVRPIMIHRVVYGALERFFAILLEDCGGILPLWLAPEQVRIVPIADRHEEYAGRVEKRLKQGGIDVTVDNRGETMQSRIRDAEMQKIPYVLIVGDKEEGNDTVSVRPHGKKDTGMVEAGSFLKMIKEEIRTKKNAER